MKVSYLLSFSFQQDIFHGLPKQEHLPSRGKTTFQLISYFSKIEIASQQERDRLQFFSLRFSVKCKAQEEPVYTCTANNDEGSLGGRRLRVGWGYPGTEALLRAKNIPFCKYKERAQSFLTETDT